MSISNIKDVTPYFCLTFLLFCYNKFEALPTLDRKELDKTLTYSRKEMIGSNGKSTTTSFLGKMLKKAEIKTWPKFKSGFIKKILRCLSVL